MTAFGAPYGENVLEKLTPQMFTSLPDRLMKGASLTSYSGLFQRGQQNLRSDLINAMSQGKELSKAYGGFAGTGVSSLASKAIKDAYGKEMGSTIQQIASAQSQAQEGISDWFTTQTEIPRAFAGV